MVIEIKKSTNPEYTDTIRISGLAAFEYAILSKDEFLEPLTGTGEYGDWAKYNVLVHEFVSLNPATGDKISEKPNKVCGYFAAGKSLMPKLVAIELNQKFKISQITLEGKAYKMYKVEIVNEDGTLTEVMSPKKPKTAPEETIGNQEKAPNTTLNGEIRLFQVNGIDIETVKDKLADKYQTTADFVMTIANAM